MSAGRSSRLGVLVTFLSTLFTPTQTGHAAHVLGPQAAFAEKALAAPFIARRQTATVGKGLTRRQFLSFGALGLKAGVLGSYAVPLAAQDERRVDQSLYEGAIILLARALEYIVLEHRAGRIVDREAALGEFLGHTRGIGEGDPIFVERMERFGRELLELLFEREANSQLVSLRTKQRYTRLFLDFNDEVMHPRRILLMPYFSIPAGMKPMRISDVTVSRGSFIERGESMTQDVPLYWSEPIQMDLRVSPNYSAYGQHFGPRSRSKIMMDFTHITRLNRFYREIVIEGSNAARNMDQTEGRRLRLFMGAGFERAGMVVNGQPTETFNEIPNRLRVRHEKDHALSAADVRINRANDEPAADSAEPELLFADGSLREDYAAYAWLAIQTRQAIAEARAGQTNARQLMEALARAAGIDYLLEDLRRGVELAPLDLAEALFQRSPQEFFDIVVRAHHTLREGLPGPAAWELQNFAELVPEVARYRQPFAIEEKAQRTRDAQVEEDRSAPGPYDFEDQRPVYQQELDRLLRASVLPAAVVGLIHTGLRLGGALMSRRSFFRRPSRRSGLGASA